MMFDDRVDAGRRLAQALASYKSDNPIVLALPRGGVPVAFEVARALDAQLDVFVVRKLGAPFHREFGIGAIAEDGTVLLNPSAASLGIADTEIAQIAAREKTEAVRRVQRYRGGRDIPNVQGRTVLLIDDGIATGGTAVAAIRALRARRPARLVLAIPVAPVDTVATLRAEVDELVCLATPQDFWAIGQFYRDFGQVSDEEVVAWLERAHEPDPQRSSAPGRARGSRSTVQIKHE